MMILLIFTVWSLLTVLLVTMTYRLARSLRRFRVRKQYTATINAPSVSVCIPARNETHAMTQCLEQVLASDYRKLEVIVYDDSSADDTSVLIRSFAHAGVRFVPGSPLPEGWVGKNHALQVLADEASGTYIVFMDVDTSIQPTTISQLVGYMVTKDVRMVSVIPDRRDGLRLSVLFGHLRYFWQLVMSRPTLPATSSALWMIDRHTLLDTLGGFGLHKADVAPEAHMAAQLGTRAYHCLAGFAALGVSYEKKWRSQVETSRRLLLPSTGGRVWQALLAGVALLLLNVPAGVIAAGVFTGWTTMQLVAFLYLVAFMALYGLYTHATWRRGWWLGALFWPLVIFQELLLFVASVSGYARHTITWKGRLLTAPTIRADHLEIDA